jgi:uncharacterized protein (TIGR02147 family)
MVNLFVFEDYRAYLRAFYADQKARKRGFSFRGFAKTAGLASPNYLKLVIEGERRITDKSLPQFVKGLKLTSEEACYFRALVAHHEAKDVLLQKQSRSELERLRVLNLRREEELQEPRMDYLRHWHHMVVRELVTLSDFEPNSKWIVDRMKNRITEDQAKDSLDLLLKLGLIENQDGRFVQADPLISTGDDSQNKQLVSLIHNIHKQMSDLGMQTMAQESSEWREMSGLSIAVPLSKVPEIRTAIRRFRRELNQCFSSSQKNEAVYYFAVQFFPVTKLVEPLVK